MSIDLDDIRGRIVDGIYGDDRMTDTGRDDAFSALDALIAEVEWLRVERAAVVVALRSASNHGPMGLSLVDLDSIADDIERGEHRRKENE